MTAELVGAILQGGFCGVLLLVLWLQARERREDRQAETLRRETELKAQVAHWSDEVEVLHAMRDSLVRIETRQVGADQDRQWLRNEMATATRRLARLLDRSGDEVTAVGPDPRRRESR